MLSRESFKINVYSAVSRKGCASAVGFCMHLGNRGAQQEAEADDLETGVKESPRLAVSWPWGQIC